MFEDGQRTHVSESLSCSASFANSINYNLDGKLGSALLEVREVLESTGVRTIKWKKEHLVYSLRLVGK